MENDESWAKPERRTDSTFWRVSKVDANKAAAASTVSSCSGILSTSPIDPNDALEARNEKEQSDARTECRLNRLGWVREER